jgi:hypothetical protein
VSRAQTEPHEPAEELVEDALDPARLAKLGHGTV